MRSTPKGSTLGSFHVPDRINAPLQAHYVRSLPQNE